MKHNTMKLLSWNTNGLRATVKQGYFDPVMKLGYDIVCLQETKADEVQLPDEARIPLGYHSYFASSKIKKGYSGVAIYSKEKPERVEYGLGIPEFDDEGRVLIAHFKNFSLLNIYFPNGGGGEHRLDYKFRFYDAFLLHIDKLKKSGRSIIFCGDVNTAHTEIDLARPKDNVENTGFLPEERAWIDQVINHGYTDTFRSLHPNTRDAYSYWDMKTRARERNVGWRIDYFFVSVDLLPRVTQAEILPDIFGSDHCPVTLEVNI